jgi:UDP-N-acetyl-D-glucosamine dehydrogenase
MPFYPGPGLGGHCIPIDPFYLSWKARASGFEARFIELAGAVNGSMPHFVIDLVSRALNESSKSIKGSSVLVVGVAYKANIDDIRESPALDIIEMLRERGARVSWYDPHVEDDGPLHAPRLSSLDRGGLAAFDCAVITTAHRDVDHKILVEACPVVVDTRNALKGIQSPKILRL